MSGFEALGLACNVFQTISFARDTFIVCRDIYNGQKSPDPNLEDKAAAMIQASQRVEWSCCKIPSTPEEKALIGIAQKCTAAAKELDSMVKSITKKHKQGKVSAALYIRFKSLWNKSDVERLDKALADYTSIMQVLLTERICNESKANQLKNQDNFRQLDGTLQSFILQIGNGSNKMEDLLKNEAETTREHVTREVRHTEQSIKEHFAETARSHEETVTVQKQRERLLRSLKFPEMYSRQNNIMEPEEATFERIFRSFEQRAFPTKSAKIRGIDKVWKGLLKWLRSTESLFWVQGKPGSGKSTLLKRLAADKATQRLLNARNPDSIIVSHYFYLIGSSSFQQNIAGFYSSVMHQILTKSVEANSLTREILQRLPLAASKDHLGDWSNPELRDLLRATLNSADMQHVCLFIDGLDEYVGADGPDGLLKMLQAIYEHPKVKMCVSSRPEPRFTYLLRLAPTLRLHDLTRPDMEAHVQLQLSEFIQDGRITRQISSGLTRELLEGAQGVFLWLHLVLRSVKEGIRNGDDGTVLMDRIRELPQELEELYASMWLKVNQDRRVYQESAAMYLGLALTSSTMSFHRLYEVQSVKQIFDFDIKLDDITLFEMLCCSRSTVEGMFLEPATYIDYGQVEADLETVGKEIEVRCAGLLEVVPAPELVPADLYVPAAVHQKFAPSNERLRLAKGVNFIHRTARDFLTTTTAGEDILRNSKLPSTDLHHARLRAYLCLTRLLWQECQLSIPFSDYLDSLSINLASIEVLQPLESTLMRGVRRLYEADLIAHDPASHKRPLACELADFPRLEAYAIQQLEDCTASIATDILRDAWELEGTSIGRRSSIGLRWDHFDTSTKISRRDYEWLEQLSRQGADSPPFRWVLELRDRVANSPPLKWVQELLRRGADPFSVGEEYRRGSEARRKTNAVFAIIMRYFSNNGGGYRRFALELLEIIMQAQPTFVEHDWLVSACWMSYNQLRLAVSPEYSSQRLRAHLTMCTSYLLRLICGSAQHTTTLIQPRLQSQQSAITSTRACLRAVSARDPSSESDWPHFFLVKKQESLPALSPILLNGFQDSLMNGHFRPTDGAAFIEWQRLVSALMEIPDNGVLEEIEYEEMLHRFPHGVASSSGDSPK